MNFRSEQWADCEREVLELIEKHWREIALDQNRIPLSLDVETYRRMAADGNLNIVTARQDARLVGYYVSVVRHHPHYSTTKFGFLDAYFLLPEYRRGPTGLALFRAMEDEMQKLGVKSMISATKRHFDLGPLFSRLGWTAVGTQYQKWIGD